MYAGKSRILWYYWVLVDLQKMFMGTFGPDLQANSRWHLGKWNFQQPSEPKKHNFCKASTFFSKYERFQWWLLCNRGLGRRMAQRGGKKRVIWDLWNRMVQFFVTFLGWWKRDPFKGESWPPRFGDPIGRFESPGEWFNLILPPSMMWKTRPHNKYRQPNISSHAGLIP